MKMRGRWRAKRCGILYSRLRNPKGLAFAFAAEALGPQAEARVWVPIVISYLLDIVVLHTNPIATFS